VETGEFGTGEMVESEITVSNEVGGINVMWIADVFLGSY
jgi:hypothetical protein